ncbi:hypothetical protein BV25DRAFT_1913273 [Artomyces pyxidatus]|uniref:Uncharacterized protein n=1 Tax=Artomyces pyxidatus TaxID=48021 RepID=A0ACB8TAK0_9AGAM|nr:hypothetical protein BV25DRAFT_1913273 [Artomyces pyxidatus]
MSLVKIPFLASGAVGAWLALTPPNPPPAKEECQRPKGIEKTFGKLVRLHALVWKTVVIGGVFAEIASLLLASYTPALAANFLTHAPTPAPGLTPLFLLGWLATLLSGLLRLWCYHALGPLFTFEITLRAGHRLVTAGPYAYVRHPSYAGIVLGVAGTLLLHLGPGSWAHAAGWPRSLGGCAYAAGWGAAEAYVLLSILLRAPQEDALLRAQFGAEWDAWAARVPYRVVPGVF